MSVRQPTASRPRQIASPPRTIASRRAAELRRAQIDQLTGALGRELGIATLEREINRARRGNGRLVLAYVDVDGLKEVNDRQGHAAGDALLRDVVGAIQTHLRSYDPIVRVGGDEFVCALGQACPRTLTAGFRRSQPRSRGPGRARRSASASRSCARKTRSSSSPSAATAALYEAKHAR